MASHKYIDRICLIGALLSLLISLLFMNGQALGIQAASRVMGYETRLFDTGRIHTIDIVMDDWDFFIDTCENEEYSSCAVVIDNEAYKNVGLRAKGNTSLSMVSQLDSDRYSFKIECDHYDSGKTYYGLDKLSLNNIIQDNTFMKDYLTYRLMGEFGVNAPLCSFVYITVNGEDWGLYLAAEGLEDGFLQRNYGQNHGELYKPDSTGFGGGRGNGRDFNMDGFMDDLDHGEQPLGESLNTQQLPWTRESSAPTGPEPSGQDNNIPRDFSPPGQGIDPSVGFGRGGGIGSADVMLQYIDDDPDSYANIFDNAKTDVTQADQARLIQSLNTLSQGGDVSDVVDIDQVLRYFVVHNFVVNGDSYTGSIVHNYYLYEEDGRLSMLPWDYNLAFGAFQENNASSAVNDPIDTPLSVTGSGDRPMADWIFSNKKYTAQYHQYFQDFLNTVDFISIIDSAYALTAPYVEKDPTKFCTVEQFETGVEALKAFCTLRAKSVAGQLTGAIPSTSAEQAENQDTLVDASALTLSDMGAMNNGGGFDRQNNNVQPTSDQTNGENGEAPGRQSPSNFQRPEGTEAGNFGGFPGAPGGNALGSDTPQAGTTLVLLAASALVLLAGLAAAFKFKR